MNPCGILAPTPDGGRNTAIFPFHAPRIQGARWRETTANWCERGDSNSHGLPHWHLKPARLPIPPLSQRTPPRKPVAVYTTQEAAMERAGSILALLINRGEFSLNSCKPLLHFIPERRRTKQCRSGVSRDFHVQAHRHRKPPKPQACSKPPSINPPSSQISPPAPSAGSPAADRSG